MKENIQKCKKYLMHVQDIIVGASNKLTVINKMLNECVDVLQSFSRKTVYNTVTRDAESFGKHVKKLANILSIEYDITSRRIIHDSIKTITEINHNIDYLLGLK